MRKAVIPVAGLGTRGLPFTKEIPKECLPVLDTPVIQLVVEEILNAGLTQIVLVTGKGKSVIEDYFDPSPQLVNTLRSRGKEKLAAQVEALGNLVDVITVRQKSPLGLGHAVLCAEPVVGAEPFAVLLADEIFFHWDSPKGSSLKPLVETAQKLKRSVVGVLQIDKNDSSAYGMADVAGQTITDGTPAKVLRTVEKPKPADAPSDYALIGRYVFEAEIFEALRAAKPGSGGEIQLTDGIDSLAKAGKVYAMTMTGNRFDVGNLASYLQAQVEWALHRPDLVEKMEAYLRSLK